MFSFPHDDADFAHGAVSEDVLVCQQNSVEKLDMVLWIIKVAKQSVLVSNVAWYSPDSETEGSFLVHFCRSSGEGLTPFSIFRCIPFDANHRYVVSVRSRAQPSHQKAGVDDAHRYHELNRKLSQAGDGIIARTFDAQMTASYSETSGRAFSFKDYSRKEYHHEQRSEQETGFKERTGKNHEGKESGQTREKKPEGSPGDLQSRTEIINCSRSPPERSLSAIHGIRLRGFPSQ
jgi:hypothetical protein